jgi:cytochrome P450
MSDQCVFDPETVADPHPYFAQLRHDDPVHRVDGTDLYLVTRIDLVKQIVADTDTFSNHYLGFLQRGEEGPPYIRPIAAQTDDDAPAQWVLATADPPDHGRHRRVLQTHLSANAVETLVPTMRQFATELFTSGVRDGRIEWMKSCAELLPMRVVAQLLELAESAIPRMLEFGYASGERIGGLASLERLEELDQLQFSESAMFVLEAYEAARTRGQSASLIGDVVAAVDQGEINETEALALLALVVIAGGESTTSLIGSATLLLARSPDIQRQLRDAPALIPAFVEEALRLEPSFRNHYRLVTRDTEIAGIPIPRGAHVALTWPAANRDPGAFPQPDALRLDRPNPRTHVGFGWGIHLCVGAHLARAEARVAIETLLAHSSWVQLDPQTAPPEYIPNLMIRRLQELHLSITPVHHT